MKTNNARILVIGAGVNGSICAVGLQKAGVDVRVLARGKRCEDIREKGIIIEDVLQNTRSVTKVPVIDFLNPEDLYDYILVVVRKNQVSDLLPILACNRTPNIVFMVNNPSGPDEWIQALGKERVLMGFVFGAGRREGNVIRGMSTVNYFAGRLWPTPFGEVDGSITPRLKRLVEILRSAGFPVLVSTRISDYLATHAALVAVLGVFIMKRGYDRESLARYSTADFYLLVDAMRDALDVLYVNKIHITPANTAVVKYIPRRILTSAIRAALPSRFMEVGGLYHLSQAPDEIMQLAEEFKILVEKSNLPVPAIRKVL